MISEKYKGIIFDFNGVLFWDTHLHIEAWHSFSNSVRQKPVSQTEILELHGKPNKEILHYLLDRTVTSTEVNKFSHQKETIYQDLCLQHKQHFQLSPGAVELLDFLIEQHIPHTIATASDGYNLSFFIRHLQLEKWFDLKKIVFDNGQFSGKREMYVKASENLHLQPHECVVVEDSIFGMAAAHQAAIGKIIALGPKETHDFLRSLPGVSDAIVSLHQFDRQFLLAGTKATLQKGSHNVGARNKKYGTKG